jgi:hypothetical protein
MSDESNNNEVCLGTFKRHWAEAQIDGPMQTVARYDDVAKLLITIGGFALAVLAGMLRELPGLMSMPSIRAALGVAFGSMLLFFVFAAMTCYWSPKMWAQEILEGANDEGLQTHMKAWCEDIGVVIKRKKLLIAFATIFFILSFLVMMSLLLRLF